MNETAATVGTPAGGAVEESQKRGRRRFLVPVLAAVTVLSLATAGTFAFLWAEESETSPQEVGSFLASEIPQVEETASEVINLLSNYDATNIDQVAERMLEISTGNFRKDYEDTFQAGLGGALKKVSASARGQILSGPDVSFRSASEAVATARVSETIQNDENPVGRTFVLVLQITLIDTSDAGWKADRVEIVSGEET